MNASDAKNVEQYLAKLADPERMALQRIRSLVHELVPDATESISYMMPAYKYKSKPLIYFGAFKNHLSVFATPEPTAELADKLAGYKTSKGTIQFTVDNPIPDSVLKELIIIRKYQIDNK